MSLRRYIFRQLIIATLLVAIIFTCMVWLNQSVRFVDLIVNRGLSYTDFLSLVTLLLPTFIYVVLPIPAFVAVVYVYNKLESDHELVVMRSAGLSALTLARPALALGLVLSIASFALSLYLVPASYRNFKDMQQLARSNYAAVLVSAGVFNNMGDGLTVFVRERNGGGVLQGLLIHDQRDADAPVTIMAEQGTIIQGPNGPRIVLINGNRQTANPSGEFSLLYFDRYAIDLQTIREFSGDRWREPRERFLGELLAPGSSDNDRYFHSKLIAHGHGRLAGPLLPLTFAIVAAAILLSGEFGRRRRAWRFWVLAAVAIAIEALHLWSVNLAGRLPLFVPLIYASALLPAVAGVAWLALGTRRSRPVVAASHGV